MPSNPTATGHNHWPALFVQKDGKKFAFLCPHCAQRAIAAMTCAPAEQVTIDNIGDVDLHVFVLPDGIEIDTLRVPVNGGLN